MRQTLYAWGLYVSHNKDYFRARDFGVDLPVQSINHHYYYSLHHQPQKQKQCKVLLIQTVPFKITFIKINFIRINFIIIIFIQINIIQINFTEINFIKFFPSKLSSSKLISSKLIKSKPILCSSQKDLETAWYILPWKEEIYARTIGIGLNKIMTSTILIYRLIIVTTPTQPQHNLN